MLKHLQKQIKKIEQLQDYNFNAKFDPFEMQSVETAISCAVMDLEKWGSCGSNEKILRSALDHYADRIRESVYQKARELREKGSDMRALPKGSLGVQLRSLSTKISELSHVNSDEAQDRAARISRLLKTPPLSGYVEELTINLNFEEFLEKTNASGGSMIGSSSYQWPEEDEAKLGMALLLVQYFGEVPGQLLEHGCDIFGETNFIRGVARVYQNVYVPMETDLLDFISLQTGESTPFALPEQQGLSSKVFVVHGHDEGMKHGVARFLEKINLEPIILHERVNKGATIIEKLEANSDVGFAVVLVSADDEGRRKGQQLLEGRPRQNVVLEAGWFMGRFGRHRTMILKQDDMELPSDLQGLVYVPYDRHGAWKMELINELKDLGYEVSHP